MGFWAKLFGKNKKAKLGEDDGQAEFFREDFEPVKKQTKSSDDSASTSVKKTTKNAPAKSTKSTSSSKPKATSTKSKSTATKPKADMIPQLEINDDSPEVKGSATVKESKATGNGKFDIRKAKDGRFFFSLYASNHTVIAYSQIYSSITAVTTGINSVITNSTKAEIEDTTLKNPTSLPCPKWEIYIDKAQQYRFRLYATNGQIVCHSSHGYASKSGCKGGIESIKRFAAEAKVDKSYLN